VEEFVRTDSGVIVVDGNGTDRTWLARVEIDDGAPVKTVEREDIREIADAFDSSLVHEHVAFVTEAGDLVARELASGSERLVRPAVTAARVLDASGDRFYFTTELAPSGVVIDDEAGIEIPLLTGSGVDGIGSVSVGVGPTWVEARVFEAGEVVESQHVFLPDLRELRQPGSWACVDCARRDSDVILMRGPLGLYRVDPESDTPVFVRETGGYALLVDDRIRLFDVVAVEPPAFAVSTYRVLDMALDGTDVHDVLEENVNDMLRMADGRWAYVRKVGPLGYGEVVVFDEETGERRVVTDTAGAYLSFLNWRLAGEEDSGRLLYHQRGDEQGHGIWLVHVDRLLE
jgi:hypothetical protein